MDGRVSLCELSINVVMSSKPKMLGGMSHKRPGTDPGA